MPRKHKNLNRIFVQNSLHKGQNSLHKGSEVELERDQANHLINVLRKKTGDELIIFNGIDGAWIAKIISAKKNNTTIEPIKQIAQQPKNSDIYYGFAPLKKSRLDYMMQKATEMGAGIIQPIFTQHTQVKKLKNQRIEKYVVEAAQQCEILNIPKISPQTTLKNLLKNWKNEHGERKLILADETKEASSPLEILKSLKNKKLGLLIGPEGGFSDEELELLHAQDFVVPISLGTRILRADTAAVAALALIQTIETSSKA